jgi:hypothetical protein
LWAFARVENLNAGHLGFVDLDARESYLERNTVLIVCGMSFEELYRLGFGERFQVVIGALPLRHVQGEIGPFRRAVQKGLSSAALEVVAVPPVVTG